MARRPPDTTPPQVSISYPSNNSVLTGLVNIQAQATDNTSVSKVEIYVDNVLMATGYASSCNYIWDTTAVSNASHSIKAIASDTSKNTKTAQISVNVNNAASLPPVNGEQIPISGAVVSSFFYPDRAAAQAIDNNPSTYWEGRYATLFGRKIFTNWWLRLDLNKPYNLSSISIFWDKDRGAANYSIQGSNDYTTWANLLTNQTSIGGGTNPYQKDHVISGRYQYIRVFINKAQVKYPKIYEVKIYGQAVPTDTTPPVIVITSPQENFLTNQKNITLNYTVDGERKSESRVLIEGANTLTVSATDAAGNSASKSVNGTLDTTPPAIVITSPQNNFLTNQKNITINYTVDGEPKSEERVLSEGANTLTINATDAAGNSASKSVSGTLDTAPPAITITSPQNNFFTNQKNITINYTVDGTLKSEARVLNDGANTLTVSATDTAGNSASKSINVTLDTTPPAIVITSPQEGFLTSQTNITLNYTVDGEVKSEERVLNEGANTLTVNATDAAGNSASKSVNGTLDTTPPAIVITSPQEGFLTNQKNITLNYTVDGEPKSEERVLSEGANTLTVNATDAAGNSASKSVTGTLDSTAIGGTVKINNDAAYTKVTAVTLTLSAQDGAGGSGITQMQFSHDGASWSAPEAYATSKSWTLLAGDGEKTVYVKFSDTAGNWSSPATDTIILDATAPAIVITSPQEGFLTNQKNITINYTVDGEAKSEERVLNEGANTLTVSATDVAGNSASKSVNGALDSAAPSATVKINNDAAYTKSIAVTLTLSAQDSAGGSGILQMQFSHDGASWSNPEAYATTKAWNLPAGDGTKPVYIKVSDKTGNWSAPATDTIILDTTAPAIVITSPQEGFLTNQKNITLNYTVDGEVKSEERILNEGANTLTVNAADAAGNSASKSVNGTLDTTPPAIVITSPQEGFLTNQTNIILNYTVDGEPKSEERVLNEGANTLTVNATDAAGNSASKSVTGTLDSAAIGGTVKINNDAAYTKVTAVTLTLSAQDGAGGSGITQMQFSHDGASWSAPEAYATSKSWTLTAGDGEKGVYVKFSDTAGNWSSPATDTIVLDATAPVIVITSLQEGFLTNQKNITLNYTVDGEAKSEGRVLNEGANTLTVNATDAAGNSASKSVNGTLDTTPPEIIITSPQNNFLTNQKNITINYTVDGQPKSESRALNEGANTLTVNTTDAAGNSAFKSINGTLNSVPPAAPQQLCAASGNAKAELLWTANTESDLAGYNIYRSQAAGAGYTLINTAPVSAVTYQDSGLANGLTYYYAVTAIDSVGNQSGYSNQISVTPDAGPSETEPNNDFSSANPLQPGAYLRGNINPSREFDYFKITVPGPGKLYVNLSGLLSSAAANLYLYDANQNFIAQGYNYSGNDILLERQFTSAGDYYVKVVPVGSKIFSYRLQADFVTLWISDRSAYPDPFSPNADGKKDTTRISASVTADSNITINILGAQGQAMRTFSGSGTTFEQTWDGKDNSGAVVADGTYTFTVDAVDLAGARNAPQVSSTVTVDNTLPSAIIIEPAAGAVLSGTVPIKGLAGDLNFRNWILFTGQGPAPAEWNSLLIGFNPQSTAGLLFNWDTTSMPNGDYVLKLQVRDNADNIREFLVPVNLSNSSIYNISDAPDPFSPNGDGQKDALTIKASLTSQSNWTIKIKDAQNSVKRAFTGLGTSIAQAWDGKDTAGAAAPDGVYTYAIDAVDAVSGANSPQVSGQATLDNTLPEGSITAPAAAQTVSGEVGIYGTATDAHFYYGDLYYAPSAAPADCIYITSIPGALATAGWLGTWNTANLPSGDYIISLRLYDHAGNIKIIGTPVKVYNTGIYNVSVTPEFFSPNADGQQDTANIKASITALCNWTINIKNAQGTLTRAFTGNGTNIDQPWDGKDTAGATAPDGVYTCTIDAKDTVSGQNAAQVSGQVTLDNTLPTAAISTPAAGAIISDTIAIKGLCDDANFNYWKLTFGQGASPASWNYIYNGGSPFQPDAEGNPRLFSNWSVTGLAGGDYILRLEAWDQAGNKFTANTAVVVQNAGPDIIDLTVTPSPFTPDGLDANTDDDVAKISFGLSDNGFIKIGVYDLDMNLVKNIYNDSLGPVPGSSDKIAFYWYGTDDNGKVVRNGEYKVIVSTGFAKQASAAVIVNDRPIFDQYKVEPQTFSPDGDGVADTSMLSFSLTEDSLVKVEVYNAGNVLVRSLATNAPASAGQLNNYTWDGKNSAGQIAGQGSYYFKVSAHALTGNEAAPLVMNVFFSTIPRVRISNDTINPYTGGVTDILYTLAYDAKLSIKIYNAQGVLVRKLITLQARAAGDHSETWDGKDDNGKVPRDGYYYFTIEDAVTGTNQVVYDPSKTGGYDISHSISAVVSEYNPLQNKPAVITYNLPRSAKINIKVRLDKYEGPAIKVLKYQVPTSSGEHQCIWDGRDEFGNILSMSTYTISVWGYTLPDNAVIIEGGRPVISGVTVEPIKFNPVINPYAQEQKNSTTITFNLSQGADVSLDIYNTYSILVRTLLNKTAKPAGINSVTWDGKNEQGQALPNDYYRIEIQAKKGDNYSDMVTGHTEIIY